MGKKSQKTRPLKNSKTKFIIIGVIAAILIAGIAMASMGPDLIKADNSKSTKLSLDTRNGFSCSR